MKEEWPGIEESFFIKKQLPVNLFPYRVDWGNHANILSDEEFYIIEFFIYNLKDLAEFKHINFNEVHTDFSNGKNSIEVELYLNNNFISKKIFSCDDMILKLKGIKAENHRLNILKRALKGDIYDTFIIQEYGSIYTVFNANLCSNNRLIQTFLYTYLFCITGNLKAISRYEGKYIDWREIPYYVEHILASIDYKNDILYVKFFNRTFEYTKSELKYFIIENGLTISVPDIDLIRKLKIEDLLSDD